MLLSLAVSGGQPLLALEDGDVELVFVDAVPLGRRDQFPRVGDGFLLEVVAKAEVAQHLEEGVVAIGEAHVLQVVMFAAGAHALLRRGGARVVALLDAEEDVLELIHAGVGEQQRRVVGRHEGGRVNDLVSMLLKIAQEGGADFGA